MLGQEVAWGQASTTYKLRDYGFGAGGGPQSSSNYTLEGIAGEVAGAQSSTTYKVGSGLQFVQQANVPAAPTVSNPSSWYNKLSVTVNRWSGDATDVKYLIAISTDNFSSDIRYVQNDNTVGSTFGTEDYQTYTTWGGASGFSVIGLNPNTTYYFRVRSTQGKYSESGWGPIASAATSTLQISFDIDVGGVSDPGETASPYTVAFGSLTPGSVTTATDRIWIDMQTNADAGGYVYIYGANAGLKSTVLNYSVPSVTTNLSAASEGYGVQGSSTTQTSGGPLAFTSPYNGASENVGIVNTTIREVFNTGNTAIVGGRGSVLLKAKISSVTPAANDYAETITMVATAAF